MGSEETDATLVDGAVEEDDGRWLEDDALPDPGALIVIDELDGAERQDDGAAGAEEGELSIDERLFARLEDADDGELGADIREVLERLGLALPALTDDEALDEVRLAAGVDHERLLPDDPRAAAHREPADDRDRVLARLPREIAGRLEAGRGRCLVAGEIVLVSGGGEAAVSLDGGHGFRNLSLGGRVFAACLAGDEPGLVAAAVGDDERIRILVSRDLGGTSEEWASWPALASREPIGLASLGDGALIVLLPGGAEILRLAGRPRRH